MTQTAGTYEGITYSTETYDVYLYVMNNADLSDLYVGYVVSVKQGETEPRLILSLPTIMVPPMILPTMLPL